MPARRAPKAAEKATAATETVSAPVGHPSTSQAPSEPHGAASQASEALRELQATFDRIIGNLKRLEHTPRRVGGWGPPGGRPTPHLPGRQGGADRVRAASERRYGHSPLAEHPAHFT
jgi:hypothetical protein